MPLYRAVKRLSGVAERGGVSALAHLSPEQIAKLERIGAIARISPPPLAELPGWSRRAEKLAAVGIVDAEQLMEADVQQVVAALRVKDETARRYQQAVLEFLVVKEATPDG